MDKTNAPFVFIHLYKCFINVSGELKAPKDKFVRKMKFYSTKGTFFSKIKYINFQAITEKIKNFLKKVSLM